MQIYILVGAMIVMLIPFIAFLFMLAYKQWLYYQARRKYKRDKSRGLNPNPWRN